METARLHHEAGQAEARREMEALREVARLKDEFLGQVSHELRTPLTIIHGYSELMVDGLLEEPDSIRQSADEIHTSSALMLRLVDDLLDTSRLDAGRIQLKTDTVELSGWLARLASGFGQANPSHRVVSQLSSPLPALTADLDRLGQVMNNLLSNAARYSAAGTEIRVSASVVGDQIEVQVVDQPQPATVAIKRQCVTDVGIVVVVVKGLGDVGYFDAGDARQEIVDVVVAAQLAV